MDPAGLMDFAHPATQEAYTKLWLDAVFAQMRAERNACGWAEATVAWCEIERYANALGSAQDARIFKQMAEDAAIKAIVEEEMNRTPARPSDGT